MSDVSHGPDWWQDDSGKWHPPHQGKNSQTDKQIKSFSTQPDTSGEVNEDNITSHFKDRYGIESQVIDPEMIKDLRKAKEDTNWGPSKGSTKARFMRPQTPSDLFSGGIGLSAGILLVIAAFLDWASAGGSLLQGAINPIKDSNGVGVLLLGSLICLLSVLLLIGKRKRWVGLSILLAGAMAVFLSLFSLIDITNTSDAIPENLIDRYPSIDIAYANEAKLDISAGLWLSIGGSVASLLAGISGLKRHI